MPYRWKYGDTWVTSKALTEGILCKQIHVGGGGGYFYDGEGKGFNPIGVEEEHLHNTRAEAIEYAEKIRNERITKLEAEIQRLKSLKF